MSKFDVQELAKDGDLQPRDHYGECVDPLGLTVMYDPGGTPSVDFIFVHGLGGTSYQTWSKNQDLELCWPQKWLPHEPDICTARVLTFGYNANFSAVKASGISDISDFAKSLLFEMKYGRDEQLRSLDIGTAPIVFVMHSMGGLVFKKAYMLGINNDEHKNIAAQVRSVVFLSTPHRGTNLAEILNRMLSVSVFGHSAKRYISELKMNSSALENINENFRHVAPSLRIFSFYETLKTPIGGKSMTVKSMMILEKDSSILGYPGETSQPLNADHHNVCKFSHRHEQNYKSVRAVLATLISDYGQKVVDSLPKSLGVDSTLRSNFEHVEAVLSQHHTPEDDLDAALEQRSSGTCEWLLSDPAFID